MMAFGNGLPGVSTYGNYQSIRGNTLQTNPGMAETVAADSLDQGLVGTYPKARDGFASYG